MTQSHERRLTVALAQMDVAVGEWELNLRQASRALSEAAAEHAQLVVLPEMWASGYDLDRTRMHARLSAEEVVPQLAAMAAKHHVAVVGSLLMEDELGRVVNRALAIDNTGRTVGWYDKVHLFSPMGEDRHLTAGNATPVLHVAGVDVALAVCFDLRFPELFRRYALDGATLILLPAEWPSVRIAHWQTLVRARAIENQVFIAACNRVGTSGSTSFGGCSVIVDPWGAVVAEGGSDPAVVVGDLDLTAVRDARDRLPTLSERRPDVYDAPTALLRMS